MALLVWVEDKETPKAIALLARMVEGRLAFLGRPQLLARATRMREQAIQKLEEWSHIKYSGEAAKIERMFEKEELLPAYTAGQQLLQRCLAAGEEAYPDAAYVIARTYRLIGRILRTMGDPKAALPLLTEARRRFQILADAGETDAESMIAPTISESGDCLMLLGQLDEATVSYEEGIKRAQALNYKRAEAVIKVNFGTLLFNQERLAEALEIYKSGRDLFESLGEPGTVATLWTYIGKVYAALKQFDQAERAYRQSLAIFVQQKNRLGEADSLATLGNLYEQIGRLEDATAFYQQATDLYAKLHNGLSEGRTRANMASVLVKLKRYDEARHELNLAIECRKPYGDAAEL